MTLCGGEEGEAGGWGERCEKDAIPQAERGILQAATAYRSDLTFVLTGRRSGGS